VNRIHLRSTEIFLYNKFKTIKKHDPRVVLFLYFDRQTKQYSMKKPTSVDEYIDSKKKAILENL
jgi:hypothetical protein